MNKNILKLILSSLISLTVFLLYINSSSEQISDHSSIIPSIATFENIDINKRISNFYWSLFLAGLSFSLLSWAFKLKNIKSDIIYLSNHISIVIILLLIGLFNSFGQLNLTIPLIILLILFIYERKYPDKKTPIIQLVFILPWTFLFIEIFNIFHHFEFQFIVFLIITTLILIPFFSLGIYNKIEKFFQLFSALIPLILVVYKEFYMILNQHEIFFIHPTLILFSTLFLYSLCLLLFKKYIQSTSKNYILQLSIIGLLMGLISWKYYYIVYQHTNEIFELANHTNPIMRLMVNGDLPIIDALSSHVISDLSLNPLYVFLNGYTGKTDFMIYFNLLNFLIIPGAFHLLNKIFRQPLFVFILLLFTPSYEHILGHYNGYVFVSLLLIWQAIKHPKSYYLLLIFTWNSLLLIYKIEVGASSIILTSVLFIINTFLTTKIPQKGIVKNLIFILFIIVIAVGISFYLQPNLIDNFLKAKDYFTPNQAHGFAKVTFEPNLIYYFNYIIIPFTLIIYGIYLIQVQIKAKTFKFLDFVLIGLISFYVFHTQRGLVRHSLIENSTFHISSFAYLIISLIVYKHIRVVKSNLKYGIFVASFIFCVNAFSLETTVNNPSIISNIIYRLNQNQHLKHYKSKLDRALDFDTIKENTAGDFIRFMDGNFDKNATFLDFCNIPMFYFYTQREVPSYFNQYMQNTVTDYLQEKNIELLKTKDVPVVLFSQNPQNWWDAIDGVENTIRNFRMAQYIYSNYKPHSSINNINVWVKNNLELNNNYKEVQEPNHKYNLMQYPAILGQFSKSKFSTLESWENTSFIESRFEKPRVNQFLKITFPQYSDYENLKLQYFNQNSDVLGEFKFTGKSKTFIIPVSAQYNWFTNNKLTIKLSGNTQNPNLIELIELYEYKK